MIEKKSAERQERTAPAEEERESMAGAQAARAEEARESEASRAGTSHRPQLTLRREKGSRMDLRRKENIITQVLSESNNLPF